MNLLHQCVNVSMRRRLVVGLIFFTKCCKSLPRIAIYLRSMPLMKHLSTHILVQLILIFYPIGIHLIFFFLYRNKWLLKQHLAINSKAHERKEFANATLNVSTTQNVLPFCSNYLLYKCLCSKNQNNSETRW